MFKPKKIIFASVFIWFNTTLLFAQYPKYNIQSYSIEQGLPNIDIKDIIEDSLGFVWIATSKGLVQFNGYSFKEMVNQVGSFSELSNHINCIADVPPNHLLIGTRNGLFSLEKQTLIFKKITPLQGKNDLESINTITANPDGSFEIALQYICFTYSCSYNAISHDFKVKKNHMPFEVLYACIDLKQRYWVYANISIYVKEKQNSFIKMSDDSTFDNTSDALTF